MGFAAPSHTQRMSSDLLLPPDRVASSTLPEEAGARLALVCREGVVQMDITDETKFPCEDALERDETAIPEFVLEEHTERILRLFRRSDASDDEVKDIDHRRVKADPRRQIILLYDEYRPRLFGYMRGLGLKQDEAEEVIQETFVLLTVALLEENAIENVPGWIVRVAHHHAMNVFRRKEREASRTRDLDSVEWEAFIDPASGPEETYLKEEQVQRMRNALAKLSPQQRRCFHLRVQGFRYKDIGLALGITEQRAGQLVNAATARLEVLCG